MGLEAGADMRVGRESREEFGESLAQLQSDKKTLGSSILVEEADDYLRKKMHRLPEPVLTEALRVGIVATHGVPDDHLFEIRVY